LGHRRNPKRWYRVKKTNSTKATPPRLTPRAANGIAAADSLGIRIASHSKITPREAQRQPPARCIKGTAMM
jgi:hypothetical protein